ncbi:hypothetical protein [Echinicola vietnamensis]|uniref:Transcription elongation factor n=1 Tax=Echinicola vietnamensis (strain DSM 17526 / LMG 23754 / KMM 6221) TaxID=926556 RepID=L0G045_ECHVK|nr:hypothetical protein [Echinicola vietnamensis]AGA78250.1 hypothetical protein Echvi_1997 [Echinicola vietnamensis DSM 17526]
MTITKKEVYSALHALLQEKQKAIEANIDQLKQSAAEDTKSSAGDKYETGREMVRQEIDKAVMMQQEYQVQMDQLNGIDPEERHEKVRVGSFVVTDRAAMFIAVGFGKIEVNGQVVFVISPQAPLARLMMNKAAGASLTFNGTPQQLVHVS